MNTISKKFVESEVPEDPSKRNFIKVAGASVILALGRSPIVGCAGLQPRTLEETLRDYKSITKGWDPIYGPPVASYPWYGGRAGFKGHQSDTKGKGAESPGIDYDVPIGIPIVAAASGVLYAIPFRETGGLVIWLDHSLVAPGYNTVYAHLSDRKIDERYKKKDGIQRLISCNEIIALSGNSGRGPLLGDKQPEHLHFGLGYRRNIIDVEYFDPEKHGIDGGKPIVSDGETNLSVGAGRRLSVLERVLGGFGNRLQTWQDEELQELKGTLLEYYRLLGNSKGTRILDSKHFHDMRALLKRITLEEKKYIPGTKPYLMMVKIVGYSTDEKQKIIVMLPYIAPNLVSKYKLPVYE